MFLYGSSLNDRRNRRRRSCGWEEVEGGCNNEKCLLIFLGLLLLDCPAQTQ